jgi:hypothetical protein
MQDTSSPAYFYGVKIKEQAKMETAEQNGLYLFKSLIKDGCEWQGDVLSKKWSECVFIPMNYSVEQGNRIDPTITYAVEKTLKAYDRGIEYTRKGNAIWIA